MISTAPLVLLLGLVLLARGRPTESLDTQDLLLNGQRAQQLNAAFQNLTVDDACNTGDRACISGDLAKCVDDKWQTSKCRGSLQCFALPSVKRAGVVNLSCTSERSASSLIASTGATGGIAVASNSTDPDTDGNSGSSDDSDDNKGSDDDNNGNEDDGDDHTGVQTVTVTAFFSATTRTLSPEEASSILDSLTRGAATTITVGAESTTTASVSPVFGSSAGDAESSVSSSSSVILLTAATVAATPISGDISASVTATTAAVVASSSSENSSGYGY